MCADYKVIFVGPPSAGKSTILMRLLSNSFHSGYFPTIGIDYYKKDLTEYPDSINYFDFGGTFPYFSQMPLFEDTDLVFMVYDNFTEATYHNFEIIQNNIQNQNDDKVNFILLRNKLDINPITDHELEIIKNYCRDHNCIFLPISAKIMSNFECIETFIHDIIIESCENLVNLAPLSYEKNSATIDFL